MPIRYAVNNRALKAALWVIDRALMSLARPREKPAQNAPVMRVLVAIQAHLGDAILATAVIPALQQRFPGARLGFLVHPDAAQVVAHHSAVTWVHPVEHWRLNRRHASWVSRLGQHWRTTRACERAICEVGYDLAIDLYHYFPNSIPLLRRSGVPRIVGWSSGGFGPWLDVAAHDAGLPINVLHRHAALLRLLDIEIDPMQLRPVLELTRTAKQRWADISQTRGLDRTYVALHVGAHAAHRRWPVERWRCLAQSLMASGYAVLLLGHGAVEQDTCRTITLGCPAAIDLSGQLDWDEMVAAIAASSLLISHDSAAVHVGAGFVKPRICIAAGINDLRIWLEQSARSVVLMKPVPCAPCLRTQGCSTMDCIRGVSVQDVLDSALRLLHVQPTDADATAGLREPHGRR